MTSFDTDDSGLRQIDDEGDFTLLPAVGLCDPRASDAGRDLMKFFHGLHEGTRLLTRGDFSPVDLKPFLTNIVIFDLVFGDDGLV